jgi:hypothetical protein
MNEIFGKNQFNLLFDKATLDGIVSVEREGLQDELYTLFTHFYSVLKSQGHFLCLSLKNLGKYLEK